MFCTVETQKEIKFTFLLYVWKKNDRKKWHNVSNPDSHQPETLSSSILFFTSVSCTVVMTKWSSSRAAPSCCCTIHLWALFFFIQGVMYWSLSVLALTGWNIYVLMVWSKQRLTAKWYFHLFSVQCYTVLFNSLLRDTFLHHPKKYSSVLCFVTFLCIKRSIQSKVGVRSYFSSLFFTVEGGCWGWVGQVDRISWFFSG